MFISYINRSCFHLIPHVLGVCCPALYKVPKTLLSWATNPPQIPLLHVTTCKVHRCRNRKWYRIRWRDWLWWTPGRNYVLLDCIFFRHQARGNGGGPILKRKKWKSSESLGYKFTDFSEHGFLEIHTSSWPVTMFLEGWYPLSHLWNGSGWPFDSWNCGTSSISHVFEYMFKHCYTFPVCIMPILMLAKCCNPETFWLNIVNTCLELL
jgi:hypothetical protein